ncbi:MAG: hypothetical protein WAK84_09015 [Candidatus Cybelea sp.]
MRRFLLTALLAALPIVVAAATLVPSAILASPSTYDGQTVTVSGTVSNFMSKSTAMGQFSGFQLCDSKCINVIDKTNQTHANGSAATLTGTFHASFKAPHKTWSNALTIGM